MQIIKVDDIFGYDELIANNVSEKYAPILLEFLSEFDPTSIYEIVEEEISLEEYIPI